MLSFPRDLMVDIHCPGQAPFADKINAAYATCNVQGAVATLKNLTGVDINYLITVNFRGFRQVVNRLDGVWVDVDHRYFNRNDGTLENNYAAINLRPGYQRLGGQPALDFVRFRHTDTDFHRNARQQAFMKAMKEQVASSFSITDLPGLLNTITSNVEVGRGGGSGISPREVLRYALFAYGLPPGHVFQSKIEGLTGYAQLYTDPANIDQAVAEFLHPDVAVTREGGGEGARPPARSAEDGPPRCGLRQRRQRERRPGLRGRGARAAARARVPHGRADQPGHRERAQPELLAHDDLLRPGEEEGEGRGAAARGRVR